SALAANRSNRIPNHSITEILFHLFDNANMSYAIFSTISVSSSQANLGNCDVSDFGRKKRNRCIRPPPACGSAPTCIIDYSATRAERNPALRQDFISRSGTLRPSAMSGTKVSRYKFGLFEVDLESGELFRNGQKLRLQEQPFQVLVALLERPTEVVTRDE